MTFQKRIWLQIVSISFLILSMSGCGTVMHPSLPENGPTMEDIYKDKLHTNDESQGVAAARERISAGFLGTADKNLNGYTRTANNELNTLFPRLPNPTVAMYVYPHLAGLNEAPVPGYTTSFTFYKEEHFALPGEIAMRGSR